MPKEKGFTLIELMVVIAIIAILAVIGAVVYSGIQKSSRISKRIQDLDALKFALEAYKSTNGVYPIQTTFGCVSALSSALVPTFIAEMPKDPLEDAAGNYCYQYYSSGTNNNMEYKLRTNWNIWTSGEMKSEDFQKQPNYIDPARDGTQDCIVQTGSVSYRGWAIYQGGSSTCGA